MPPPEWSARVQIPGTSRPADSIALALEPQGKAWCIWSDEAADDPQRGIYVATRQSGKPWRFCGSLGVKGVTLPALAITPDGTKVAAWQETVSGVHRIGVFQWNTLIALAQKRKLIPSDGKVGDFHPALVGDSRGTRHLVFSRGGTIWRAQSKNGKKWTLDQVSPTSTHYFYPSVACDALTGLVHVAYWADDSKNIYYTFGLRSPGGWSKPELMGSGQYPNVSAGGANICIAFTEGDAYQPAAVTFDGTQWSQLKRTAEFGSSFHLKSAIDSEGDAHLAWMQFVNGSYSIYYAAQQGDMWTKPFALPEVGGFCKSPAIALDANDSIHVVYLEETGVGRFAYATDYSA